MNEGLRWRDLAARLESMRADPGYPPATVRQMERDCAYGRHLEHVGEGISYVALVYNWLQRRWQLPRIQREVWLDVLLHNRDEPAAMCAALMGCELFEYMTRAAYFDMVCALFGERLVPVAHGLLIDAKEPWRAEVYAWVSSHNLGGIPLHLTAMTDTSQRVRDTAIRALVAEGDRSLEHLVTLLEAPHARTRSAAARGLRALGLGEAEPAIARALGAERSGAVRTELEAARAACDPFLKHLTHGAGVGAAYTFASDFAANEAVMELREIAHGEPSAGAWVRLCNLVERFSAAGQVGLALDYITHSALTRWPEQMRTCPWGWETIDHLSALSAPPAGEIWLPVHVLSDPRSARLVGLLKRVEYRCRDRRFDMKTLPYFLDTLERCWSWCETKNVPIESLDIVCDGGGGYGAEARTTRMSLHMGFGVTFERARTCVPHAKPGLRSVRVPLPPAHPLRAHHPTTRGSLDLGKLLWLTSRA